MISCRCPFRTIRVSSEFPRAAAGRRVFQSLNMPRALPVMSMLAAIVGVSAACGCRATPNDTSNGAEQQAAVTERLEGAEMTTTEGRDEARAIRHRAVEEIERRYVIGPMTARDLGYRIDWQYPDAGENIKVLKARDDAVFALDNRNFLTRVNRDNGVRLWRLPIAEPILEIFGLTFVQDAERVYVTTGGAVLELDSVSGSQVGRQTLEKIANTAPAIQGPHLVYGARNGQLIWHSYTVAYQWRAYQISRSIRIAPVIDQNVAVTIGVDGRVAGMDVRNARMLWDQQLLGRVEARPAIGDGGVFIAGTDQHLWAFDLFSGRTLWRYLSESSLTTPPTFIDDHVYQYIPGQGLVCFEAFPLDQPGGRIVWKNPDVRGEVVGMRRNRLFVWDRDNRTLWMLDARRGGTVQELSLPQVHTLLLPTYQAEEILAASDDGRIVRLLPRN